MELPRDMAVWALESGQHRGCVNLAGCSASQSLSFPTCNRGNSCPEAQGCSSWHRAWRQVLPHSGTRLIRRPEGWGAVSTLTHASSKVNIK